MSEVLAPIVYQLGVGGIGGFLVGYAIKKVAKLIVMVLGFFFFVLIYLGYVGVISVNYDKLADAVSKALPLIGGASGALTAIVSNLPFAGSFTVGFILGLKKG